MLRPCHAPNRLRRHFPTDCSRPSICASSSPMRREFKASTRVPSVRFHPLEVPRSAVGHLLQGRPSRKPSHVRCDAESGPNSASQRNDAKCHKRSCAHRRCRRAIAIRIRSVRGDGRERLLKSRRGLCPGIARLSEVVADLVEFVHVVLVERLGERDVEA